MFGRDNFSKTFIIAEAGINHNGQLDLAKKLVEAAKTTGADAVKFQSFKAEWMCLKALEEKKKVDNITGGSQSAFDLYKALELSPEEEKKLVYFSREQGIECFFSVFDPRSVDYLEELDLPYYKIASGDLTHRYLIERVIKTKKPILLSTGLANYSEVLESYEWLSQKADQFALLHCISMYPVEPSDVNLRVIPEWIKSFDCPIGFSDHSKGLDMALGAVTLGATVIEKHFTLSNEMDGPDHALSLNPNDFKTLVEGIRKIENALGASEKKAVSGEKEERVRSRRGIYALKDLAKGHVLSISDLCFLKPEGQIQAKNYEQVLSKSLRKEIKQGEEILWEYLC